MLVSRIYDSGLPVLKTCDLRTIDIFITRDLETRSSEDQKATSQISRMIMNHNSNKFG